MRIFLLTANYELRVSRKSNLRDHLTPYSLNHLTSVISFVEHSTVHIRCVQHKETCMVFFCDSFEGKEIREDGLLFFLYALMEPSTRRRIHERTRTI